MRVIRDSGTGSVSRLSSKRAEARDSRAALPFESIKIAARIIDPVAFRRRREKERSEVTVAIVSMLEICCRDTCCWDWIDFRFSTRWSRVAPAKKGQFYRDSTIRPPFRVILTLCSLVTRLDNSRSITWIDIYLCSIFFKSSNKLDSNGWIFLSRIRR